MNDSNKKPIWGGHVNPMGHGYVYTLVIYDILSTPWVIHNFSGPWNELVGHPVGVTYCLLHGVFPCCELCVVPMGDT